MEKINPLYISKIKLTSYNDFSRTYVNYTKANGRGGAVLSWKLNKLTVMCTHVCLDITCCCFGLTIYVPKKTIMLKYYPLPNSMMVLGGDTFRKLLGLDEGKRHHHFLYMQFLSC